MREIRVRMPEGVSSVSVAGVEISVGSDGIAKLDNPEHIAPLVAHGGVELGDDDEPGTTPVLIGTDVLPASVDIGKDEPLPLGEVVRQAHAETGISVDEWNNLPQPLRDKLILLHVQFLRGEIGHVAAEREAAEQAKARADGADQIVDGLRGSVDKLRAALKEAGGDPDAVLAAPPEKPDFGNMTKAQINAWLTGNGGEAAKGALHEHVKAADAHWAKLHPQS